MVAIYFVFQSAALIGFGDLTASRSLYLTVHLPMLIIGQVLLQSLFVEAIVRKFKIIFLVCQLLIEPPSPP